MKSREGAWVGWAGEAGDAPEPFDQDGMYLRPVPLSEKEVAEYYEGFSNDTLWPIYHDVIVPATFHRDWWNVLRAGQPPLRRGGRRGGRRGRAPSGCTTTSSSSCRRWCASCARTCASAGSTTSRSRRSSCSPSCRGARALVEGLLGADFLGFQRSRRRRQLPARLSAPAGPDHQGRHRPSPPPRSTAGPHRARERHPDLRGLQRPRRAGPHARGRSQRAKEIRESLGNPRDPHARRRPARLHQGHPPPAQGLRGAARRTAPSPHRTTSSCRSPPPAASAWRPTASCARRSRPTVGPDQRRVRRHRLGRRALPAPLLPPRRDGRDVPRR